MFQNVTREVRVLKTPKRCRLYVDDSYFATDHGNVVFIIPEEMWQDALLSILLLKFLDIFRNISLEMCCKTSWFVRPFRISSIKISE